MQKKILRLPSGKSVYVDKEVIEEGKKLENKATEAEKKATEAEKKVVEVKKKADISARLKERRQRLEGNIKSYIKLQLLREFGEGTRSQIISTLTDKQLKINHQN